MSGDRFTPRVDVQNWTDRAKWLEPIDPSLDLNRLKDTGKKLDPARLDTALRALLDGSCVGFAYQLRSHGRIVLDRHGGWARMPAEREDHQGSLFTASSPMNIGSVGKLFTAMATVRLLADNGLTPADMIGPYLPAAWSQDPGSSSVTFAQLMTHSAGLGIDASVDAHFPYSDTIGNARTVIANGPDGPPVRTYRNINFIILRVLCYQLLQRQHPATADPPIQAPARIGTRIPDWGPADTLLQQRSAAAFDAYLHAMLLKPAGVTASYVPFDGCAAYYRWPYDGQPGEGEDVTFAAGAGGWYMSAADTLTALAAVRSGGHLVSSGTAAATIAAGFGVDEVVDSDIGAFAWKNGGTNATPDPPRIQQTVVALLPGAMELAVFVNSNVQNPPLWLAGPVRDAITAAIRPWNPITGFA